MRRALRIALILPATFLFSLAYTAAAMHRPGPYVPLCSRQIVFSASYLAGLNGNGPSYLFRIKNKTAKSIKLAEPVPSSAHWYARVGNKWLWRASSGSGGSYVDAINERGPVFAYQPKTASENPKYIIVRAHGKYEWTSGESDNPALAYRPGCERCNYPGEREYKAVFAYAYLPPTKQHGERMLPCGLRTNFVDMPPKALAH
jgi:hypothetical protein